MSARSYSLALGKVDGIELYVIDEEKTMTIVASKNERVVGKIEIGSKAYFYDLFGREIFSIFVEGNIGPMVADDDDGSWQEKIFLGENGIVMLFSKEILLLKVNEQVLSNIKSYLQTKSKKICRSYAVD